MKKIISLLMVVILFGLTACGEQGSTDGDVGETSNVDNAENVSDEDNVEIVDTDWTKGELQFEGKTFQLPCKFSELEAMGWHLMEGTELYEDLNLGPQIVFIENENYDPSYVSVNAGLYSSKERKVELADCEVVSIVVTCFYDLEEGSLPSISIDGLTMGDSRDKMMEILGEPDTNSEDTYYSYSEQGEGISYEVTVSLTSDQIMMLALVAQPHS